MEKQNKKLVLLMLLGLIAAVALGFLLDQRGAPVQSSGDYQIRITEICSKNESIIADNDGLFRDYIELYNDGPDVSLAGFTLTDGQGESAPFSDTILHTGEYRLVFLGAEVTGFSLSASGGDCIQLKDPAGGIVVQTNVAAMTADQVMTLHSGLFRTGYDATPGFSNDEAGLAAFRQGSLSDAPAIVISEILAENVSACPDELGRYADVIELHNVSGQDLCLSSFWLSDDPKQRFRFRLPDVTLAAEEYLLVHCDGRNYTDEAGTIHANFGLSLDDVLCLTDSTGSYITADVAFAGEDRSVALGESGIFEAAAPSLGFANTEEGIFAFAQSRVDESALLVISEVLLSDAGVPFGGQPEDVVEIYNRTGETVSTAGWYLSDGGDPYEYPLPEQELAPGEYLVLVCSPATTGFSLREGETVMLTTPDYRISSPVSCLPSDPGMSISRLSEGYGFALPSLGYPNDEPGQEDYAKSIQPAGLLISEVMTGNRSYLLASYGVGSDWVELYNASGDPIALKDYHLSDDPSVPEKHPLPDVTLNPGEYYIILLADKPDKLLQNYAWLPMTLSSEGDGIYLSRGGSITDYAVIPALVSDVSYGRPQDSGAFSTLASVTPGAANSPAAEPASMPRAVTAQGVYEDVEYLDVELEGEGEIYYTTDCTAPGPNATLYTGPIRITGTTVIRAVCRREGMIQSQVLDLTYLLNEHDNLPAVSLVLNHDDLWSAEYGIYATGYHGSSIYPHKGSNFWENWEKPGSVTLMEKDGGGFTSPCGIKIFGNFSRGFDKKAFSCLFRDSYGASSLEYPLFGDEGLDSYEAFILRASGQDSVTSRMRDVTMTSLVGEATNIPVQNYRPVVLYLNGKYWGVYYIREKVNEHFIAGHYNVPADSVLICVEDGLDCPEFAEVHNYIVNNDITDPEVYARACELIDMDIYIDYHVAQLFIANPDNDNIRFFRYDGGKWTWVFFDTDMGFRYPYYNALQEHLNRWGTGTADSLSTKLINTLMLNSDFKDQYLTRLAWQLENIWPTEKILDRIDEHQRLIEQDMLKDCKRWHREYSKWLYHVEKLRKFARYRGDHLVKETQEYFHLTDEQMRSYGFFQ